MRLGLWGLVGLGGVGGVVGLVDGVAPPAPPAEPAARPINVPVDVAGYAQLAVGTWLGAGPDDQPAVKVLFLADPELSHVADRSAGSLRAGRLAAVAAREVEPGYWAVTVAAEVMESPGQTGWQPAGTWFFEVGIAGDESGRLIAVSEPAMVPPPAPPADPMRLDDSLLASPRPDDGPFVTAIEGFLRALLTGTGELDRYTAPGVELPPIQPVPFRDVTVDAVGITQDGDAEARARVRATGTTQHGTVQTFGYEVALASRDGRWEIASLSGAPVLAARREASPHATSTTTSRPLASSPSTAPLPGA